MLMVRRSLLAPIPTTPAGSPVLETSTLETAGRRVLWLRSFVRGIAETVIMRCLLMMLPLRRFEGKLCGRGNDFRRRALDLLLTYTGINGRIR